MCFLQRARRNREDSRQVANSEWPKAIRRIFQASVMWFHCLSPSVPLQGMTRVEHLETPGSNSAIAPMTLEKLLSYRA